MEGVLRQSTDGQERLKRQMDKETEFISHRMEAADAEENVRKKSKSEGETQPQTMPSMPGGGCCTSLPLEIQCQAGRSFLLRSRGLVRGNQ